MSASLAQARAFTAQGPAQRSRVPRAQRLQTVCSAGRQQPDAAPAAAADRRAVLLGLAGAVVAAPLAAVGPAAAGERILPVSSLGVLQKRDIVKEVEKRACEELKKVLTAADAPAAMTLLLHDAGTYDRATGTGGCNGSVVLPEELNRPENRALKPLVEKLRVAKEAADARRQKEQAPLSWADTIVLAAKVTQEQAWRDDKISKAASPEKGEKLADGFGNPITVRLGRVDATEPAPPGRLPAADAPLEEVQAFFAQLGAKPNKKPPFWEKQQYLLWPATQADTAAAEQAMADFKPEFANWKRFFDTSKTTVTRTSYEEDLGATVKALSSLGAKYDLEYYLCPIVGFVPDRY